jgi:hypothetical protein
VHSIAPGGAQLLYRCIRGYTPSSVRLLSFSPCDSYCGVTTARGTTHVFAVSPEGGAAGRSTHPVDVAVTSLNSASTSVAVAAAAAAAAPAPAAAPLSIEPVCRVRTRRGSGDSPLTNPTPPLAPTFTQQQQHSSAPASWSTGGGGLGYLHARAARGAQHTGSSSSSSGEHHYSSSSSAAAFTAAAAAAVPLATALRALPEGSSNGNSNGRGGNGSTVGVLTIGADCRLAESALVCTTGSSYSSGMMAVHSGSAGSSSSSGGAGRGSSSSGGQYTAVEAVEKQFWSLQQAAGWGDVRAADSDAALLRMRSEGTTDYLSYVR